MNRRWPSDPRAHHEIDVVIRRAHRWRARVTRVFLRFLFRSACRLVRQIVSRAGRVARCTASTAVQRWQQRAAVSELMRLDDRALKDLGIHRSQIHALVHGLDLSHPRENTGPETADAAIGGVVSHQLPFPGCSDAGPRRRVGGS